MSLVLLALFSVQPRVMAIEEDPERYSIIPDIPPYPKVKPVDTGYPSNIPAGLPTAVPGIGGVLAKGPISGCSTSVGDVLAANKRTAFINLLAASAEGRAVLDGSMAATVLAPTDAAVAALQLGKADALTLSTVAHYHVLQGKQSLERLLQQPGFWLNTTLTKADCPTAFQTVVVVPGNSTAIRWVVLISGRLVGCAVVGPRAQSSQKRPQRWRASSCSKRPSARAKPTLSPPPFQAGRRGVRARRRKHGAHHHRRPSGLQLGRAPPGRRAAAVLHLGVRAAARFLYSEDPAVVL